MASWASKQRPCCDRLESPPLLHESPDELRNLIRSGIEREMARIEDVDFSLRHVAAIGLPFRKLKGQVVPTALAGHERPDEVAYIG